MSGREKPSRQRQREREHRFRATLTRRPTFSHSDVVQYRTLIMLLSLKWVRHSERTSNAIELT